MALFDIILIIWLALGCVTAFMPARRSLLTFYRSINVAAALFTLVTTFFHFPYSIFLLNTKFPHAPFNFAFHLDSLSQFFVFLLSLSVLAVTCFGQSYFRHFEIKQQKLIQVLQSFFILAMLMVFSAANTFTFLFAWELMTLSSYFLVVFNKADKSVRQAGFLYLGIAHVGFLGIASAFFLLTTTPLTLSIANIIFVLTLIGFGAKAGLFPLHIWLPEAHPAAPSPISALMSGVMLKTAVYAFIRFCFYWLAPYQQTWWGYALITLGLLSMLLGVIHAAIQTDMKRLLAYSSMENLGFIILALGFAIVFYQYQQYSLAGVALLIVLLHSLSHSLFKSLLFLSTGSILHATGERNIGKLGGLIQKMPWVSACALVGCLAMAGMPLFSGFISEWLYLRLFFLQGLGNHFDFVILSTVVVAVSVLVFALAGFVIVKFFGIAFLGQPRESQLVNAKKANWHERIALAWLAFFSLLIGLWPGLFITWLQEILQTVSSKLVLPWAHILNYSLDSPLSTSDHAFTPTFLVITLLILFLFIRLFFRRFSPQSVCRKIAWGCGFNLMTTRMQESAEGFSQPIKQIFTKLIKIKIHLPQAEDLHPLYQVRISERIQPLFYKPLVRIVMQIVSVTKWIQQGKISVYLTYMGLTLIVLLIGVVWL